MSTPLTIDTAAGILPGDLAIPPEPSGVVVFAHGSGSSRHSPRNRAVAEALRAAGIATVLMDLLTDDEEREDARTGGLRFDVPLLAERVRAAVEHVHALPELRGLPVGVFGASTGAAAALVAAAGADAIRVVVSRGGRPDLAGGSLAQVTAPTMLIVGERDQEVLDLNCDAAQALTTRHRVEIVPGATHLFTEPGALEQVAALAARWFDIHFRGDHSGG